MTFLKINLVALLPLALLSSQLSAKELFLIQGPDLQAVIEATEAHEGVVTDQFPLIRSIAATVPSHQLRTLNKHPDIARIIDRIDTSELTPDEEESREECAYAGSIFLDSVDGGISWPILSKNKGPTKLNKVVLSWAGLAAHSSVSLKLDDKTLNRPKLILSGSEQMQLELESAIELNQSTHHLEILFDADVIPAQSELSGSLVFDKECVTKLASAYNDTTDETYLNDLINATSLHRQGLLGKDIGIAVLDSGLWDHPQLQRDTAGNNRVVARFDATQRLPVIDLFDESGHGSHITSVAVNSGAIETNAGVTYQGIAPNASVIAVKAFDRQGKAKLLDLLHALQWIADHRQQYNIRILNLSFAARPRWPYWLDPVNQAVMQLWDRGIVVVASAGNSGPDPMTIGAPGNIPYIITVGALTDNWTPSQREDDFVPLFSSQGPTPLGHVKPDIVAPGGHIEGVTRPGSTLTKRHPDFMLRPDRIAMTGTSQAAAVVSGAVALLLELEPSLTPNQVKCRLTSSALPAINGDGQLAYSPLQQGYGRLDIARAFTLGRNECDNGQTQLARELAGEVFFTGPVRLDSSGKPALALDLPNRIATPMEANAPIPSLQWGYNAHINRLPESALLDPDALQAMWIEKYVKELVTLQTIASDPTP